MSPVLKQHERIKHNAIYRKSKEIIMNVCLINCNILPKIIIPVIPLIDTRVQINEEHLIYNN